MNSDTKSPDYARRLTTLQTARWKTFLNVQAPYRWNIRRLAKGTTLDIGCGIGRNLSHLDGNGVGVDHSEYCLTQARLKGLQVFSADGFMEWIGKNPVLFDNLLVAHVVEHMHFDDAKILIHQYAKFLKDGGRIILITPQEAGYASDPTHVSYFDFHRLAALLTDANYQKEAEYSFPLPKIFGRFFLYNEFVSVWKKPG